MPAPLPAPDPAAELAGWCSALLDIDDLDTLSSQLVELLQSHGGCQAAALLWRPEGAAGWRVGAMAGLSGAELLDPATLALAGRAGSTPTADGRGLQALALGEPGMAPRAVLLYRPACPAAAHAGLLALARSAFARSLERERLHESIRRLRKAEQLQHALFAIADTTSSQWPLPDLLRTLHQIVAGLMYAENFFIALYDAEHDSIRFIYFADVEDSTWQDPAREIPMARLEHGLTWYLIRDGKPLMGSTAEQRLQVSGPLRVLGPDSLDWLGVPMHGPTGVRGAVVVQSYIERPRYTREDQELLAFVASHILTALDRRQAQDELEQRVRQRTAELRREVQERQRSERLQAALFQIAERCSAAADLDACYAAVHGTIGELLSHKNFYIALIHEQRSGLEFAYWVDERSARPPPRVLGHGITEYVLRSGQPMLADMNDPHCRARLQQLHDAGELHLGTAGATNCWLGVPLVCAERVVGVLAVQSHTADVRYTLRDQELLTFVSYQVANSLERKRAAEALKSANLALEQRVAERTAELRRQIAERERMEAVLQQRNRDLEHANQELAGTQSQLLQSEKMASVGQLAAGVAHEINNPIGFVHSNMEALKRYWRDLRAVLQAYGQLEGSLPDVYPGLVQLRTLKHNVDLDYMLHDIGDLIRECLDGIVRVEKIVRDLKDFSHPDEAEWQRADLHHGLDSTLNVAAAELKYKVEVVREYGTLPLVCCLPFQLNQVFMNLLVNAAQAIERQGRIVIRTGCSDDGREVWLEFSDTGRGIEPGQLSRIFEPFYTTKPVGVGTGLGLSVSYGIVQKHGGSIEVRSTPGQGSSFTLRLPVEGRPPRAPA